MFFGLARLGLKFKTTRFAGGHRENGHNILFHHINTREHAWFDIGIWVVHHYFCSKAAVVIGS
jgi:hypothetical protein